MFDAERASAASARKARSALLRIKFGGYMIFLTKLDGKTFMLNEELIETVNETPDTVIVLENGHSYIVRESMNELQNLILENNRQKRRARLIGRKDEQSLSNKE